MSKRLAAVAALCGVTLAWGSGAAWGQGAVTPPATMPQGQYQSFSVTVYCVVNTLGGGREGQ